MAERIKWGGFKRWRILRKSTQARGRAFALLALSTSLFGLGCARGDQRPRRPSEVLSADSYVQRAVRESAQGVVIFDLNRQSAGLVQDRLREIAQDLRAPAAECFLARAIDTVELEQSATSRELSGVPAGQVKFRVRLRPDGSVSSAEVLETGFADPTMVPCLEKVIARQRFPHSPSALPWFVDLVYWVNLGFHSQLEAPDFVDDVRRQVALLSSKATGCLRQHGVRPGKVKIQGLTLASPEGLTMINRARGPVPTAALSCLEISYRSLKVAPERDSFARPIFYTIDFEVLEDGMVTFADAEWIRLRMLEESAQAGEERATNDEQLDVAEEGATPTSNTLSSPGVVDPMQPALSPSTQPAQPPQPPQPTRPAQPSKMRLSPR